jgi:alpha-amylase/alpha-mannosidase (GH57 family)
MASVKRSVVIHGHFYQPPREDPWLEELETQASAAPFHDWNARVEAECYRTVVAARVPGREGRIRNILNTLRFISFNFGPTLLEWMEKAAPRTYQAILGADRHSRGENSGYGNALAQAYHHTILPLASRRDKITEIRWGAEDFRRRFRRDPLGMWLPETAVDAETLDILAQQGIAFTIVAPHQVVHVPKGGLPGLYRTAGGRSIALFVYDGPLSHDVAFGHLLKNADEWVARMAAIRPEPKEEMVGHVSGPAGSELETEVTPSTGDPEGGRGTDASPKRLVSLATDGETYGHHHRFGEMALAAAIQALRSRPGVRLENFASFLAHSPPEEEVTLVEPTSWSCAHGVERWRSDCGCRMDPRIETQQEWRSGLREAMEWLAEEIHEIFEAEAPDLMGGEPWETRNEYGRVVVRSEEMQEFLDRKLRDSPPLPDRVRAAELLELERNALRLFTSCGWFFDDLAGIEPLQILRYAARSLDLVGQRRERLEEGFLSRLRAAVSNEDPPRDGATIFLQDVKPPIPPPVRVAAGAMAMRREGKELPTISGIGISVESAGRIRVSERTTGRQLLLEVEIEGNTPREFQIRVRHLTGEKEAASSDETEYVLDVLDLPEAFRVPLEELVLKEALHRWVPPRAQSALLAGTATLDQVLGGALVSAVRELEEQDDKSIPDEKTLLRVRELALLHTRRGLPIPFDAQTDFYRILEAASPERGKALAVLRKPLGFVPS